MDEALSGGGGGGGSSDDGRDTGTDDGSDSGDTTAETSRPPSDSTGGYISPDEPADSGGDSGTGGSDGGGGSDEPSRPPSDSTGGHTSPDDPADGSGSSGSNGSSDTSGSGGSDDRPRSDSTTGPISPDGPGGDSGSSGPSDPSGSESTPRTGGDERLETIADDSGGSGGDANTRVGERSTDSLDGPVSGGLPPMQRPEQGLEGDDDVDPNIREQAQEFEQDFLEQSEIYDDPDQVQVVYGEDEETISIETTTLGESAYGRHLADEYGDLGSVEDLDDDIGEQAQEFEQDILEQSEVYDDPEEINITVGEYGEFSAEPTAEGEAAVDEYLRQQAADQTIPGPDEGEIMSREQMDVVQGVRDVEDVRVYDPADFVEEDGSLRVSDEALVERGAETSSYDEGELEVTGSGADREVRASMEARQDRIEEQVESQSDYHVVGFEQTGSGDLDPLVTEVEDGQATGAEPLSEVGDETPPSPEEYGLDSDDASGVDEDLVFVDPDPARAGQETATGTQVSVRDADADAGGGGGGGILTTESVLGAAAVGVATPEPVSTGTGGVVLAGLGAGALVADAGRRTGLADDIGAGSEAEITVIEDGAAIGAGGEVEVDPETTGETGGEISTPTEAEISSEISVPEGGAAASTGGEISIPSGVDQPESVIQTTPVTTGIVGQEQEQVQDEDPVEITEEDILSRDEVEISEQERQQQTREELERRQGQFDPDEGSERQFPTGESAIVGVGQATQEEEFELVEEAQDFEIINEEATIESASQEADLGTIPAYEEDDESVTTEDTTLEELEQEQQAEEVESGIEEVLVEDVVPAVDVDVAADVAQATETGTEAALEEAFEQPTESGLETAAELAEPTLTEQATGGTTSRDPPRPPRIPLPDVDDEVPEPATDPADFGEQRLVYTVPDPDIFAPEAPDTSDIAADIDTSGDDRRRSRGGDGQAGNLGGIADLDDLGLGDIGDLGVGDLDDL